MDNDQNKANYDSFLTNTIQNKEGNLTTTTLIPTIGQIQLCSLRVCITVPLTILTVLCQCVGLWGSIDTRAPLRPPRGGNWRGTDADVKNSQYSHRQYYYRTVLGFQLSHTLINHLDFLSLS